MWWRMHSCVLQCRLCHTALPVRSYTEVLTFLAQYSAVRLFQLEYCTKQESKGLIRSSMMAFLSLFGRYRSKKWTSWLRHNRITRYDNGLEMLYADNGRILFLAQTWTADEKRAQPESFSYWQAHDSLTCSSEVYMTLSLYIGCCRWPHYLDSGFLSGVLASSQGW